MGGSLSPDSLKLEQRMEQWRGQRRTATQLEARGRGGRLQQRFGAFMAYAKKEARFSAREAESRVSGCGWRRLRTAREELQCGLVCDPEMLVLETAERSDVREDRGGCRVDCVVLVGAAVSELS